MLFINVFVDKSAAFGYHISEVFCMDYVNKGKNGEVILSDGKNEAAFEFLEMYANHDEVMKIWQPLLSM